MNDTRNKIWPKKEIHGKTMDFEHLFAEGFRQYFGTFETIQQNCKLLIILLNEMVPQHHFRPFPKSWQTGWVRLSLREVLVPPESCQISVRLLNPLTCPLPHCSCCDVPYLSSACKINEGVHNWFSPKAFTIFKTLNLVKDVLHLWSSSLKCCCNLQPKDPPCVMLTLPWATPWLVVMTAILGITWMKGILAANRQSCSSSWQTELLVQLVGCLRVMRQESPTWPQVIHELLTNAYLQTNCMCPDWKVFYFWQCLKPNEFPLVCTVWMKFTPTRVSAIIPCHKVKHSEVTVFSLGLAKTNWKAWSREPDQSGCFCFLFFVFLPLTLGRPFGVVLTVPVLQDWPATISLGSHPSLRSAVLHWVMGKKAFVLTICFVAARRHLFVFPGVPGQGMSPWKDARRRLKSFFSGFEIPSPRWSLGAALCWGWGLEWAMHEHEPVWQWGQGLTFLQVWKEWCWTTLFRALETCVSEAAQDNLHLFAHLLNCRSVSAVQTNMEFF